MDEASIFRNFSDTRQGCAEEEKLGLIRSKFSHFLSALIKGAEADTINKGVGSHVTAVKYLNSVLVNPKKRFKWDELVKLESFLSKLHERSRYENEITTCLEIEHYLESSNLHVQHNTYQHQKQRKWPIHNTPEVQPNQQHQNKPLTDSPNSWTPVSVSPRARTTFLAEPEQPQYPQRTFGNQNYSRSTRPNNWEPDRWTQPNGHYDWNDKTSNRGNFWQDNYRSWDGNNFYTSMPNRNERFNPATQQQPVQKSRPPETSSIRDPRLLSGRVSTAAINIHSPCPPSVYVPTSRKLDDEIETPRSPSPELDVPVVPPVIIGDAEILQEDPVDPADPAGVEEEKKVFSCKHCSYIGKKIVSHHVNRHAGKEVPVWLSKEELASALSKEEPEKSEERGKGEQSQVSFIEDLSWIPDKSIFQRPVDCKICGYSTVVKSNLIQHLISHRKLDGGSGAALPNMYCRFCEYFGNSLEEFRDHVTTHTGEFAYTCGYCTFKGFSSKAVKSHISADHVGKPLFVKRDKEVEGKVTSLTGFVCSACRFVQLLRENVMGHIVKHGVEKEPRIIKINMARMSKNRKMAESQEKVAVNEEIKAEKEGKMAESVKKKTENEEPAKEIARSEEDDSQLNESFEIPNTNDEESNENSDEEEEESESDATVEERSDSPPLLEPEQDTAMSDEDNEDAVLSLLTEDGGKIAPSISETISRLQSMLRKGVKRSSLPPPILEPMDGKMGKSKDEAVNVVPEETSGYAFKCGAKGCGFFCGEESAFLQHLQSSHTPREAPCTECGGCFAQWKLLVAHIRLECEANDKLPQYACGFASCEYATNNEQFFFTHTRTVHKKEIQLPCCYCEKNFTLVTGLVRHLKEGCRAAKVVKSRKVVKKVEEVKKVESESEPMVEESGNETENVDVPGCLSVKVVYKCPVCDHKSLEREVFRVHVAKSHPDCALSCTVCSKELTDVDAVIEHIETEHGEERVGAVKRPCSKSDVGPPRKKSRVAVKEVSETEKPTEKSTEKSIEKSMEKSTKSEVEHVDSVRDPAVECLGLKSPFALATMLKEEKLEHLFKCMGRSCTFTASRQEDFTKHLSEGDCKSRTVCCYCMQDCKSLDGLVEHVVKQHGYCAYQCKYCFYRAITDDYVNRHQVKRHVGLKPGNLVCHKDPNAVEPVNEPISADFILLYKCVESSCLFKEADPNKFKQHYTNEHSHLSSFPCHMCETTCDAVDDLITHYKEHGFNNYQCGFCLYGSETDEELLFHLCSIHPNKKGQVIVRSVFSKNFLLSPVNKSTQNQFKGGKNNVQDQKQIKDGAELKVGHALFQCGYPPCEFSSKTAETLREHMITCLSAFAQTSSTCPHCRRQWRTMTLFLDHLVNQHGGRRFMCGRCPFRGPSVEYVQSHVKLQHGIPPEQTQIKLRDPKADPEMGEYVVHEIETPPTAKATPIKLPESKTPEKRMMVTRKGTTFGLDDIDRLPMQSIFPREVLCALCGYATKVRSNLIRHLQLHKRQEDSDTPKQEQSKPSKSPKKRDKSKPVEVEKPLENEGNEVVPQFVVNTSLYRCAVQGCDYLALDNTMYKCHVTTLHPDVSVFPCPHCGDRTSSLDRLLIHFRLHGPRLYKCSQCSYVSYRLHQVETHMSTTHDNRFLQVVTVRENVADEEPHPEPEVKSPKKKDPRLLVPVTAENGRIPAKSDGDPSNVWCCAICTHPGPTKSIIKNHLQTSHGVRSEFKCGICSCVSNAFESVRLHFVSRHPNKEVKIMPLIVKAKDYDPNNLYISAPKESTSGSSSGGGSNTPKTVVHTPKSSMAVTRRASLSAAVAAAAAAASGGSEEGSETSGKVDGGSSGDVEPAKESESLPVEEKEQAKEAKEAKEVKESSADKLMFVCPVCHEYRTKFRGDMRIHIYRELQYRRVQCLRCNSLFVSEKEAKHHSLKTHQGLEVSLQKNEIPEREIWVKEQLDSQVRSWGAVPRGVQKGGKSAKAVQSAQSVQNTQSETNEAPSVVVESKEVVEAVPATTPSSAAETSASAAENEEDGESSQRHFRYYCTQCCYQCEGTTDLRKHIFRHLKFKPFHCTYCLLRFSEKQQIRNHHNLFHADKEFICQRQPNLEPERFVDELLHQQRMEWKDKKKNAIPGSAKSMKTAAQIAVTKMAEESAKTVTSDTGSVLKVYACRHDGCNFSCDQLKGLKVHLMAHLRQARFRCGYCNMTGSSQYQVRRHCLSIHAGKKVLVVAIYKNESFRTPTSPTATTTSTSSSTTTTQEDTPTPTSPARVGMRQHCCPYCLYSHSLPKMISRHLMRHYVEKPFQCGHCKRTGIEKFDILYHCKKVHPELEPKVIETPLPSNPEIKPILRRGHYSSTNQELVAKPVEEDAPTDEMDALPVEVQVKELQSEQSDMFECNECAAAFQSIEEMQSHMKESHKSAKSTYKVSLAATKRPMVVVEDPASEGDKLVTTNNRSSLLKCIYCDLASDSLKLLRKHCHESHTGNEVRLRKLAVDWEPSGESILRCGYCGFAVTQMSSLWNHHVTDHPEKCVKFRIAVRKSAVTKPSATLGQHVLWCSYCSDPCDSLEQMVKHWKMFHGHLELKYKTPSGEEGIISKEITDGVMEEEEKAEEKPPENEETGVKMYGCAQCKYESDKYDMVRQHLFRHLQRFSCQKCGKMYPFEYELRKHVEVHHPGLVLDSVKNPGYDDQEKEELIRNIRVWFVGKEDDGGKRKQVARKSLRGMSQVSSAPKLRVKARKSSSCRLQSASLLQETLSKNLPGVEQMQHQIISDLVKLLPMSCEEDFACPPKKVKVDENRVSLSLDDLHRMVNIRPMVVVEKSEGRGGVST